MRRMPWVTCLWPGLPQLWIRGSWLALAVAVAAAGVLNSALLGSFGWSELIEPDLRRALWVALGVVWGAAAVWSAVWGWRLAAGKPSEGDADKFKAAVEHYLRRDWFQVQRALGALLQEDPRDPDARLMLATMLRHTGRLDEAGKQLNVLMRLEGSRKWGVEIQRERQLLAEAGERVDGQSGQKAGTGTSEARPEQKHAA